MVAETFLNQIISKHEVSLEVHTEGRNFEYENFSRTAY